MKIYITFKLYLFYCLFLTSLSFTIIELNAQPLPVVPSQLLSYESSSIGKLAVYELIKNLRHPWSATWIPQKNNKPNYTMLISERNGRIWLFRQQGQAQEKLVKLKNIPTDVLQRGQGGYLGLYYHLRFRRVYLAYSQKREAGKSSLRLISFQLNDSTAVDIREEFVAQPPLLRAYQYGGVISGSETALYLSVGDGGSRYEAQNPKSDWGSIFIARRAGNRVGKLNFKRMSIGHRNASGLFYDVRYRQLWAMEHGPQGGDELNLVQNGKNYGWPIITYGTEYGSGKKIGEGYYKVGLEQPIRYWVPSPAPGGLIIVGHGLERSYVDTLPNMFSSWQGDFLIPMLRDQKLLRLRLSSEERNGQVRGRMVTDEEVLFQNRFGRLRWVGLGPDGALYLLNDLARGQLLRVSPA